MKAQAEPKGSTGTDEPEDARLEKAQELIERQKAEIEESRAEVARALKERDSMRKRIAELESQLDGAKRRVAPKRRSASQAKTQQVELNSATFEELRGLGLSVTQSARVIAYRDVRDGYDSLDELDDVPGLPAETRRELRARLKLEA